MSGPGAQRDGGEDAALAQLDPALRRGAALFHGLADRNRLSIIRQLAGGGERRVVDLTRVRRVQGPSSIFDDKE